MFSILIISVILSYALMQAIELTSFGSRVAGRVTKNLALGTTLHQTIYVGSRVLVVPFLPMLAYLVETGISLDTYLILVIIALFVTTLISISILLNLNFFQLYFQVVFSKYAKSTIPIALFRSFLGLRKNLKDLKYIEKVTFDLINGKKVLVSFLAYSFLVTGFFIAFLLAIIYPSYQLTLSQSTAFFHGFGAVIVAFYLDPMLSRSMDKSKDQAWLINSYSIVFGRVLSYAISCFSFIILYLIL